MLLITNQKLNFGLLPPSTKKPTIEQTEPKNEAISGFGLDNYFVPFIIRNSFYENDIKFSKFLNNFYRQYATLSKEHFLAEWDFLCDGTDEKSKKFEEKKAELLKIYTDKKTFEEIQKFKSNKIQNPELKRHLSKLEQKFNENIKYGKELMELTKLQDKTYKLRIEHQNRNAKMQGVQTIKGRKVLAKQIVKLVKKRNEFAKKLGYADYYEYQLHTEHNLDKSKVENLIRITEKNLEATKFETSRVIEARKPDTLIIPKDEILPTVKAYCHSMGWDIDKLPISYDLEKRPNKMNGALAANIEPSKDVRVLANLEGNLKSIKSLAHELGHATFSSMISDKLVYIDREYPRIEIDETIATLFEKLPFKEPELLIKQLKLDKNTAQNLKQYINYKMLDDIKCEVMYTKFEMEMYKNPDQDLNKLWDTINKEQKYTFATYDWAENTHFITHPGYYHSYIWATLASEQIYNVLKDKFGPLVDNKKVSEYINNNLFKYGGSISREEGLKKLTGSELNADYFFNQYK